MLSLGLLFSVPVGAQSPGSPSAEEQAQTAFDEGRDLFDHGRFREACEKFELSQRLDSSPGTLLNLGNCHEAQGDLVSALGTFERASADAQLAADPENKQLWVDAAAERIASLTKRVPVVTVRGVEPGARVLLDTRLVERPDVPLRVQPGHHVLEVSIAAKRTHTREFDIAAGQRLELDVPALEPNAPPPVTPVSPGPVPSQPLTPQTQEPRASRYGVWPWVLGGGGVALIGTGLVTGLMAKSKESDLEKACPNNKMCDDVALKDDKESGETLALVTDVLWISGVVAAGIGVTLLVIDDGTESGTAVQTGCFDAGCGILANGSF